MNQAQTNIVKKWGSTRPGFVTERAFLHSDGSVSELSGRGVEHFQACRLAGVTINKYLKSGGVRIVIFRGECAFETLANEFTPEQLPIIKATIRRGRFNEIVFAINRKTTVIEDFDQVTVAKCKEVFC